MKKFAYSIFVFLLFLGCSPRWHRHPDIENLTLGDSQLKERSVQTRTFHKTKTEEFLKAVISTLQDEKFIILFFDREFGIISATKRVDNRNANIQINLNSDADESVTVRVSIDYPVKDEASYYQYLFSKISKSLFLEQNLNFKNNKQVNPSRTLEERETSSQGGLDQGQPNASNHHDKPGDNLIVADQKTDTHKKPLREINSFKKQTSVLVKKEQKNHYKIHQKNNYVQKILKVNQEIFVNPDNATAFLNRGILYEHMGDYQQATSDYSSAVNLDPDLKPIVEKRIHSFKMNDQMQMKSNSFLMISSDY